MIQEDQSIGNHDFDSVNQDQILNEELLKAQKLHEEQYKAFKYEIESAFTKQQASLILDIFHGTYQNSVYSQKTDEGLIRAYAALDAIHSVLVEKDIYSVEEFTALFEESYLNQMKVREEEQQKVAATVESLENQ